MYFLGHIFLSMGNMKPNNKIHDCEKLYVIILIHYPEFEICSICFEPLNDTVHICMYSSDQKNVAVGF